jgi:creatinine amidohydrolase/Fe(II)-dependent formamide hydrolase-like protein
MAGVVGAVAVVCAAVAGAGASFGAGTVGSPAVEIETMTWVEVRDRIAQGARTVIIPTGGTEQNGAHMALGKHNVIVAETARRIARVLGDALVAPVIGYVPEGDAAKRTGHMAYAGTITVSNETFAALLTAAAESFKAHGFREIVLLGDSGGNQAPQAKVAEALSRAWAGDGVRVFNAARYYGKNGGDAYLLAHGETAGSIGTHAGIRDTSELMAVAPGLVDLSRAKPDSNGATGDARRASAERGEALLKLKVEAALAEIRAWRANRPTAVSHRSGWFFWR